MPELAAAGGGEVATPKKMPSPAALGGARGAAAGGGGAHRAAAAGSGESDLAAAGGGAHRAAAAGDGPPPASEPPKMLLKRIDPADVGIPQWVGHRAWVAENQLLQRITVKVASDPNAVVTSTDMRMGSGVVRQREGSTRGARAGDRGGWHKPQTQWHFMKGRAVNEGWEKWFHYMYENPKDGKRGWGGKGNRWQ